MVPSHRVNVAMSAVDRAAVAVDELQQMGPSTATSRTAAVVSFTAALSNASALVKCQSLLEVLWELGADMRGSRQVASPTPPPLTCLLYNDYVFGSQDFSLLEQLMSRPH